MVQVSYPGVYINEVPSGSRTITGVSTSIAVFVGRTERGELNKPTLLFNYSDFSRNFGTSTADSELATATRLFFENGGTQAYVMRIANGASSSEITLKARDLADVLKVVAREAGATGAELRVVIDYDTPTPDSTFNIRVFRVDPETLAETQSELFANVSMDSAEARYIVDIVEAESQLVTVEDLNAAQGGGYTIGALMISQANPGAIATAMGNGGNGTLRLKITGAAPTNYTVVGGDIAASLPADFSLEYIPIDAGNHLVKIKSDNPGVSVEALPSGLPNDVATALQMGPARGGVEMRRTGTIRPAPSGVVLDATGGPELSSLAILGQDASYSIDLASKAIPGIVPKTEGSLFYEGFAYSAPSLLNVREKLSRIAAQYTNLAAEFSHPWRCDVQGMRLVFSATSGPANTGFNAPLSSSPATLYDAFAATTDNTRSIIVGDDNLSAYQDAGSTGLNGTAPMIGDYADAYEVIQREVDLFNLLILPRDVDILDDVRVTFWGPASTFCQQQRAFLLVDPPLSWKSVSDITGAALNINSLRQGLVKDHAAVYWSRLLATNENGLVRPVDPSGAIAGVMARTDGRRGVFKAPAGLDADIRGVRGVERMVSDAENGITNPLAVNTVRVFPNGVISWGARTMDGFDNSGNDDYKYVPIRRLALFIEESLYRGLKFAVFEPNDEPLWAQLRLAAGAFMSNLFRAGAFQGQKRKDAYFVKVDSETTTQNDINLGIVNVVVGFAPLRPAEFVVVTIQQIAGQVQT
ncbi:MAG TPA: hypothetical protein ENJ18_03595 [Nannocystis exedens]|nr:hypothetical protein [Nannocystis exedens]